MPYILLDPATAEAAPITTVGAPLSPPGSDPLPGMSLVDMRTQLDIMLGGRTDFDDTMFDLWLNQSYIDLCTSLEIPELHADLLITTVSNQPLYRLPEQVRAVESISVIDSVTYGDLGGIKLNPIDKRGYRRRSNVVGEPRDYFVDGKLLVLWPTPSAARSLSIDFRIRPDDLVNEDHYPIIPREWHEVIVRNARTKAHSDLREFDSAGITNNEVVGLVRRKSDVEAEEDSDRVVGSSVPRRRSQLNRYNSRLSNPDFDDLR